MKKIVSKLLIGFLALNVLAMPLTVEARGFHSSHHSSSHSFHSSSRSSRSSHVSTKSRSNSRMSTHKSSTSKHQNKVSSGNFSSKQKSSTINNKQSKPKNVTKKYYTTNKNIVINNTKYVGGQRYVYDSSLRDYILWSSVMHELHDNDHIDRNAVVYDDSGVVVEHHGNYMFLKIVMIIILLIVVFMLGYYISNRFRNRY